jgi:cell division protease FtsH
VVVQPPDRPGRLEILQVHTRSVPLDANVDLESLAATTPGMVGADLANVVNEAALLAAKRSRDAVTQADLDDALEKIVLGAERQVMMRPEVKRRTAYHEAGHAIVAMLTEDADPVRKISIIPRGQSLGVTFAAPDTDRFNLSERELLAKIAFALGGRAAEEIVFGDLTTGAENDIKQITSIARLMVGRWGMSRVIGMVDVSGDGSALHGATVEVGASERTQELVDEEVRRIIGGAYDEVTALLRENRERLDALAQALIERETLDEATAYDVASVPKRLRVDSQAAPA